MNNVEEETFCDNIYPHSIDTYDNICECLRNEYGNDVHECATDILSNLDKNRCSNCMNDKIRAVAETLFNWFHNHDSLKNWFAAEYIVMYANSPQV